MTPGDPLFEPGVENILVSSSRNQAGITLEFAHAALGEDGYRWRSDGVTHLASRARVRIVSSDARRALGLGANVRLIVADEPGAWSPIQGRRLWDAMVTSLGKRKTQILVVGTLAPAPLTGPASWFPALVAEGSGDGRHVALLQADPEKWKDFEEVLRVNPVAAINRICGGRWSENTGRRWRANGRLEPSGNSGSTFPANRLTRSPSSRRRSGSGFVRARSRRAKGSR